MLEAAVQVEEEVREQRALLLVGSHRQSRQSHPHLHLPDLRRLLQSRQSRHRKHHHRCRHGCCFVFVVCRSRQSRLRFPLLVVWW